MTSVNNENEMHNLNLIKIPAGIISLRDDRIKRKWDMRIESFYLSSYPVTQKLYHEITGQSPSNYVGDNNPVENVSWIDAVSFCNLLSAKMNLTPFYLFTDNLDEVLCDYGSGGFRLPTDAEWEFACKAGTGKVRYGELDSIAWYIKNAEGKTHEVGKKKPNSYGLYDMLGNVWEWCFDIYDKEKYGSYRILRGGGWCDQERGCLATNRRRSHPTFKIDDLGFRIAKSL
ncbi:MAG: SUMF1/EgtB/PvdO family nonheme iron enzyme [Clostridia bacterium]|nr:SUMF1/EgtB/PvdO family nonheme iron enzyme [Clostridia bacterium]